MNLVYIQQNIKLERLSGFHFDNNSTREVFDIMNIDDFFWLCLR